MKTTGKTRLLALAGLLLGIIVGVEFAHYSIGGVCPQAARLQDIVGIAQKVNEAEKDVPTNPTTISAHLRALMEDIPEGAVMVDVPGKPEREEKTTPGAGPAIEAETIAGIQFIRIAREMRPAKA